MRHDLVLCSAPSRGGRRGAGDGAPAPQPVESPSAPVGTAQRDGHDAAADGTDGAAPGRKAGVGGGMSRQQSTVNSAAAVASSSASPAGVRLPACHHRVSPHFMAVAQLLSMLAQGQVHVTKLLSTLSFFSSSARTQHRLALGARFCKLCCLPSKFILHTTHLASELHHTTSSLACSRDWAMPPPPKTSSRA
jgi:hypothetical protein